MSSHALTIEDANMCWERLNSNFDVSQSKAHGYKVCISIPFTLKNNIGTHQKESRQPKTVVASMEYEFMEDRH